MFKTLAAAMLILAGANLPAVATTPVAPSPLSANTIVTVLPLGETFVSAERFDILVLAGTSPCNPGATGWGAHETCFEAILPGGQAVRFGQGAISPRFPNIAGYTHRGTTTITVERVTSANYVSCMQTHPDSCRFTHYTLIEE